MIKKLIPILFLIGACQEPTHSTEIVEVKVPMESDERFVLWGSASWENPYSDVSKVIYKTIVSYVGQDTLSDKVVTVRGWIWSSTENRMVDSTAYVFGDTTIWVPYGNYLAEYLSDGWLDSMGSYEFWGNSLQIGKQKD